MSCLFLISVFSSLANQSHENEAKYQKSNYIGYIQKIYNKPDLSIFLEVSSGRFQKYHQIRTTLIFSKKASSHEK